MRAADQFIKFDTDVLSYQQAIELYGRLRKKTYAQVVNQFAKEANLICSKKEAEGGVKRSNIKQDKYLKNSTDPTKWRKVTKTKTGKTRKGSGKNPKERRMWFALAAKQGAKKGDPFKDIKVAPNDKNKTKVGTKVKNISDDERHLTKAAATIRNRRRSRSGAIAVGFLESAKQLGYGKKGAASMQPWSRGSAIKSIGRKATAQILKAFSINKVEGSYEVARRVMVRAMDKAIKHELNFAYSKLDQNSLEVIQRQKRRGR
jgi:DNA-binding protein H-NS